MRDVVGARTARDDELLPRRPGGLGASADERERLPGVAGDVYALRLRVQRGDGDHPVQVRDVSARRGVGIGLRAVPLLQPAGEPLHDPRPGRHGGCDEPAKLEPVRVCGQRADLFCRSARPAERADGRRPAAVLANGRIRALHLL